MAGDGVWGEGFAGGGQCGGDELLKVFDVGGVGGGEGCGDGGSPFGVGYSGDVNGCSGG
ncbi:Uncharacterised protein [Dermatophilus congolensis]|uniref:Uncharacterized protein n=1 Tax=Dermatophilus congolensis TaxID=1863 RepID=A0AA46BL39_9MICO|nr:Uncharacterised protein [Dermatophilus congolensis]